METILLRLVRHLSPLLTSSEVELMETTAHNCLSIQSHLLTSSEVELMETLFDFFLELFDFFF